MQDNTVTTCSIDSEKVADEQAAVHGLTALQWKNLLDACCDYDEQSDHEV